MAKLTPDQGVNFSFKELFREQNVILHEIDRKVDSKVEQVEFARLETKHELLKDRVGTLESEKVHKLNTWKVVGAVGAFLAAIGTAIGTILALH